MKSQWQDAAASCTALEGTGPECRPLQVPTIGKGGIEAVLGSRTCRLQVRAVQLAVHYDR